MTMILVKRVMLSPADPAQEGALIVKNSESSKSATSAGSRTFALLDEGSGVSFCRDNVGEDLGADAARVGDA